MEERPVFSIIMPAYNKAHCISYAIKSVLRQTFTSWELIVVDDCSTDGTADVVSQFEDARIRLVRLDRNSGGPSHPKNVGIELAIGQWLCFLDPDDMYASSFLEQMSLLIKSFGTSYFYGLAVARFSRFEGRAVPTRFFYNYDVCDWSPRTFGLTEYLEAKVGRLGTVSREFVMKNGLRFPMEFKICEDYVFEVSLFLKGLNCVYIDAPLYLYGETEGESITKQRPFDQIISSRRLILDRIEAPCRHLVELDIAFYKLFSYMSGKRYTETVGLLLGNPSLLVYVVRKLYRKYFKEKLPLYLPKYRRCIDRIFADVP